MKKLIFILILATAFLACQTDPGSSDSTDTTKGPWKVTIDSKTAPGLSSYTLSVEDGKPLSSQLTQTPNNPFDFITSNTTYNTGDAYISGYRDQDGKIYDAATTPVTKDITVSVEWGFKNIDDNVCKNKNDTDPPVAYINSSSVDFAGIYCNTKDWGTVDKLYNGDSILFKAGYFSKIDILKYLLIRGADINLRNTGNSTVLNRSAYNSSFSINYNVMKFLIDNGADLNSKGYGGDTALMTAVGLTDSDDAYNTVKYLVDKGANVNIQNDNGNTALIGAVSYGDSLRIVQYLVDNGKADLTIKGTNGKSALDFALAKKNSLAPGAYSTEIYNYLSAKLAP